ncbi:MAG: Ig-like domain-containing protein [Phycisphaerales bacterium]
MQATTARVLSLLALCGTAATALGGRTVTFETLANNTSVSSQFFGLTFTTIYRDGSANSTPRVVTLNNATASPTRCIEARGASSGDDSSDYIRIQFATLQKKVTLDTGFRVGLAGPATTLIRIRSYTTANALIATQDVLAVEDNCRTFVQVGSDAGARNIARIEVETVTSGGVPNALYEYIDDINYEADLTPPAVNITSPTDDACVCQNVQVVGTSCESDGTYVEDSLEFSATPNGPWTLIATDDVNKCAAQVMYAWNASAQPSGYYYLRFHAINEDELETTVLRRVFLDRTGPGLSVRSPVTGGIYGGNVCFDGTIENSPCGSPTSTIGWRPWGSAGAFTPIDPAQPTYVQSVVNDPFASWNTAARPDGDYELRMDATDQCGNTSSATRRVTVDNTAPLATITNPTSCQSLAGVVLVQGSVSDTNISGWVLQYTGGNAHSWTTIASGTTNVSGLLGMFNTSGLPACAYSVRLIATDRAGVSCSGNTHQTEYVTSVDVAQPGQCDDIDFNNDQLFPDTTDVDAFLSVFSGGPCF